MPDNTATGKAVNEARQVSGSGATDCYLRVLSEFGFDSEDGMHRYFRNEGYVSDGLGIDDMACDARKALVLLGQQCRLLDRSLAIINDAIMHGMPVTDEVAAVSNLIRGVGR